MRTRITSLPAFDRLRDERGVTLVELLVVLAIVGVVLAPLAASFTTALRHEAQIVRRDQAHQNARLALQRMRVDIHCAGGLTSVDQNTVGGFTLTLTQAHEGQEGWCATVVPPGNTSSGVQWCTVQQSATRWTLYRYLGTDAADCGSGGTSTFQVDYVAPTPGGWPTNSHSITAPTSWAGNIWPTGTKCEDGTAPSGGQPTVAVDLMVSLDPVNRANESYRLRDAIGLRNANRCA